MGRAGASLGRSRFFYDVQSQTLPRRFPQRTKEKPLTKIHLSRTFDPSALLAYIFESRSHPLTPILHDWLAGSPRFRLFAETYRAKIRRKVRQARDAAGIRDLRCELATSYRLSLDRRMGIEYEKMPIGQQRGPDFSVAFRVSHPFNMEVTRLRPSAVVPPDPASAYRKLAETVCEKLGQMPPQMVNLLVIVADGVEFAPDAVADTLKALLLRAERRDESYFVGRGYRDAREFIRLSRRLSAIFFDTVWDAAPLPYLFVWSNPRAERLMPPDLKNALLKPFSGP